MNVISDLALNEKTTVAGTKVFFVTYKKNGRNYRTIGTTFHEEACVWGRIIRAHGYCTAARPCAF